MINKKIIIASRNSPLARTQTELVISSETFCQKAKLYLQDLRIASICGVFLIIIFDIYTTIGVFA